MPRTVGTALAALALAACGNRTTVTVEDSANSIDCTCHCTAVNVDGPLGVDQWSTTRKESVCVPPESRGTIGDFQSFCDTACFASEQALDSNYGCTSTCNLVEAGPIARHSSSCDQDTCAPVYCEDCLPLLHSQGTDAWRTCIRSCNAVAESFDDTASSVERCGERFGPICLPTSGSGGGGGCSSVPMAAGIAATILALLGIRRVRRS